MRKDWTKSELALFKAIYPHKKNIELQQLFNRSDNSIQRKASYLGVHKTKEHIGQTRSESHGGVNSPSWKGGKSVTASGHIYITTPDGKKMLEHRYVMEKHLGRKLFFTEAVHHINSDRADNRIENLQVMEHGEHTTLHHTGTKMTLAARKKISLAAIERLKNKENHPFYKHIDFKTLIGLREKGLTVKQVTETIGISKRTYYNKLQELEDRKYA